MSTFSALRDALGLATAAAIAVGFTLPAAAGEIHSWRTEDGGYAFTDDAKAIPARYRAGATSRKTPGLASYARLTTPPKGSSDAYSERLSERLDHLRALNRDLTAAERRPVAQPGLTSLSIDAGNLNLGVPVDAAEGPVVVERVRFRHDGEMATRHNLVVKQGGKVVTIIKGEPLVGPINQAPDVQRMTED